jgi:hypothetical protein
MIDIQGGRLTIGSMVTGSTIAAGSEFTQVTKANTGWTERLFSPGGGRWA